MSRSLHIIGSKGPGGAEQFFVRLVNALAERGHAVMAVTRPGAYLQSQLLDAVEQTHVPMRNNWDMLSRWQIRQAVKTFRPDIVQTYMGRATRLTRLGDRPRPKHLARLGGYYEAHQYRHADGWIAITHGIRDYLVHEGMPEERVFMIPNFVDTLSPEKPAHPDALREQLGIPATALVVLGIGRLHPNKGFCDLLDAFSRLPASIGAQPLYLVIAGAGPLEATLKQQADQLGLSDRLRWAGWQAYPEACYRMSQLMVCPSHYEPHGNVILEAWAYGTPVLSTATAGGRELVTHGVNGMLVPLKDSDAMAQAMTSMLADKPLRRCLAEGGEHRIEEQFSKKAVVDACLEVYQKLTTCT